MILYIIFCFNDGLREGIHKWVNKSIEKSFTILVSADCQVNENTYHDNLNVLSTIKNEVTN